MDPIDLLPGMRILFLMRNHGAITHYEAPLRILAERGHTIVIGSRGAERHYASDMDSAMERLCRDYPRISVHKLPRRQDQWAPLADLLRSVRNYCRYLHPRYRDAFGLRARARQQVTRVAGLTRLPNHRLTGALVGRVAAALERRLPADQAIERTVAKLAPDVVVVTPLVDFNSYQPDYVAAAARMGIPTVWAVTSWDNLSNKGVVGHVPDRVLVWNDTQRQEAVALQGVPASRVVVTGAQTFDPWFTYSPSMPRDDFCDLVGLPHGPYVLYLCSSLFVAPTESVFVLRWLRHLRERAPGPLRRCSVLIRPHPGNAAQWSSVDLTPFGPAAVWPQRGDLPIDAEAKQRYFDSLFHASALVGVNSSSMIEGGIVGRRSFTLLASDFAHSQRGTIHFEYLTSYGFVTTAHTWEEHFAQIHAELRGIVPVDAVSRERMIAFVRPGGADEPAAPRVAAAIEEAAALTAAKPADASSFAITLTTPLSRAAARAHKSARRVARRTRAEAV